ncbi:outer membrane beta-barrel protein [Dyella jejuensis]|uniref:Outer membrane beta-barrel protein n=1 Tax=Dyella jejuensis TaxID=1432009 RepID=A0ABW8JHM0_9GAMM
MNKWISKAAVGAALVVASSAAMAVDGNFFVNGEAAGSDVNISNLQGRDQTSAAGALRLGYLWNAGAVSWGVEGGYVDLGKVNGNDNYAVENLGGPYDPVHVSIKTHGEILGGNFKLHYGDYGWFLSARGGWFHSQTSGRANDQLGYASVSSSSTGDGVYAGVGLGYDFNRHIGISLNYDFFQSRANGIYDGHFNTSMYGGTFEYRF